MNLTLQILTFALVVHCIHTTKEPDLSKYNELSKNGYIPNIRWEHFSPLAELSASVEDFTKTGTDCTRVVVFTALGIPLEYVTTTCKSSEPFLGLVHIDDVLWFYGKALVKRTGKKDDKEFVTVVRDGVTCSKTVWNIEGIAAKQVIKEGVSVHGEEGPEDKDCKDLMTMNIPPMILLSQFGRVGKFQATNEWTTYNFGGPVGARTRTFSDNFSGCFQRLEIWSYGRFVDSMKFACGPVQGVVMAENYFYYGKTVMIKVQGQDVIVFMNPDNGKIPVTIPHKCVKHSYMFDTENKRIRIASEFQYINHDLDCKRLVEGQVEGAAIEEAKAIRLLQELTDHRPDVDAQILNQIRDYKVARRHRDFNLVNEFAAVVQYFEKENTPDLKVVWVVAKGVVLSGVVLRADKQLEHLVIREDALYHDRDILITTKSYNIFTVLVNNEDTACLKTTFEIRGSDGEFSKEEKEKKSVDKTDPDCKNLLDGTQLSKSSSKEASEEIVEKTLD